MKKLLGFLLYRPYVNHFWYRICNRTRYRFCKGQFCLWVNIVVSWFWILLLYAQSMFKFDILWLCIVCGPPPPPPHNDRKLTNIFSIPSTCGRTPETSLTMDAWRDSKCTDFCVCPRDTSPNTILNTILLYVMAVHEVCTHQTPSPYTQWNVDIFSQIYTQILGPIHCINTSWTAHVPYNSPWEKILPSFD
jgi:hypothetical protein